MNTICFVSLLTFNYRWICYANCAIVLHDSCTKTVSISFQLCLICYLLMKMELLPLRATLFCAISCGGLEKIFCLSDLKGGFAFSNMRSKLRDN